MQTFKIIYNDNGTKKALYVDTHTGEYNNALERCNIKTSEIIKVVEAASVPNYLL